MFLLANVLAFALSFADAQIKDQNCRCGIQPSSRFIGSKVNPNPFHGALTNSNGVIVANVVLLTNRHVLTSAKAIESVKLEELNVILNAYSSSKPGFSSAVTKVTEERSSYNLAIVELSTPVPLSSDVHPICLPQKDMDLKFIDVVGYNKTKPNESQVRHIDAFRSNCNAVAGAVSDSIACITIYGECLDSAAVVLQRVSKGNTYLLGVHLNGRIQCNNEPVVFEKVYSKLKWIQDTIKDGHACKV